MADQYDPETARVMQRIRTFERWKIEEDAAANAAGNGGVAGIGVGPQGEPGVHLKKKRLFTVDELRAIGLQESKSQDLYKEIIDHLNSGGAVKIMTMYRHDGPFFKQHADRFKPSSRPEDMGVYFRPGRSTKWVYALPQTVGFFRRKIQEDTTKCKPFSAHDWTTIQHSQTPTRHIMRCNVCGLRMSVSRIEQQNAMLRQNRLIDTIRKRDDINETVKPTQAWWDRYRAMKKELLSLEMQPEGNLTAKQYDRLRSLQTFIAIADENIRRWGLKEEVKPDDQFAGADVFEVGMDAFMNSRFEKHPRHRYSKYVGEDEKGESIRQHGRKTKRDIVLKDWQTGAMVYLRRNKAKIS